MATEITFRRGSNDPTSGSGLTLAEPAFNTTLKTFHIGLGHGVTAAWVGAPISGLSADIAAGITYKIPTAAAVKNYISGLCFGNTAGGGGGAVSSVSGSGNGVLVSPTTGAVVVSNTGVHSFNGLTGAVVLAGGTDISVVPTGQTLTINYTGSSVSNAVTSFNGLTGAVGGVTTSAANIFTALNSFNAGISASGATFSGNIITTNGTIRTASASTAVNLFDTTSAGITIGAASGGGSGNLSLRANNITVGPDNNSTTIQNRGTGLTLSIHSTGTLSLRGAYSDVLFATATTPSILLRGNSIIDHVGVEHNFFGSFDGVDTTYPAKINLWDSNTRTNYVGLSPSSMSSSYVLYLPSSAPPANNSFLISGTAGNMSWTIPVLSFNGSTGAVQGVSAAVAGTGISVSGATGTVTITNIGVQSFNGSTGAVTGASLGANTFTALNSFNAGISASGATFASNIIVNTMTVGRGNTSGAASNTALGVSVLAVNSGTFNTGVGNSALTANTTGGSNTAVGRRALFVNTTGSSNTAIGPSALGAVTEGVFNTAIGAETLSATVVSNSTAVGAGAIQNNVSGNDNTAVGAFAGSFWGEGSTASISSNQLQTGTGGVYIGYYARGSTFNQTNEIVIGANAVGGGSNTAVIGATLQVSATVYGLFNAPGGVCASGATFSGQVRVNGNLFANNIVNALNGFTGGVTLAAGTGISVSGATSVVTITNTGVQSFNGLTGAVGGVCAAQANTFTALQTFTAGISAAGGITFNGGKVWTSANDGADSGLDADALRGVSGDRFLEEIQSGLLYGGVLTINAGNTAAVDVSAGAGIIVTVNAATGGYPAPTLQTIEWTAKTGVTLAGMTTSDFTFFRIDSSGNLQQSSSNFSQTEYLNSVIIGNAVHQSRAFVNRVHYHPIVAYASSAQYETFIRYFGPLKVDGYVLSGFGTTGGIQHTTGTAFALGANMDTDVNNPSLATDSSSVPVQQLFYLFRNAGGTYRTDPTARTTVNFGNYDDGDGTLGNVGNQSWSIQRVYKIPGFNNALYIYYGTAVYSSLTVAANNILLESFAEADITRYNGVFLGWLIVRGNGSNVSSIGDCRIIPGGFFRNTTGGGGASTQLNLDDLGDVQITSVANNEILRYDGTLWVNSAVTTLPLVTSFNGLTGAVQAVSSFNGLTGAVQGVSAAVAGTGISVSGATGAVTITNIGVQSFNGVTGAVTGVSRVNGLSGGITLAAGTGITFTTSGNTITLAATASGGSNSTTQTLDFSEDTNGVEIVFSGNGESLGTSLRNIETLLSSISVSVNGYTCKLVSLKSFYDALSGWSARVVVKPPFTGGISAETIYLEGISSVAISGYSGVLLLEDTWTGIDSSNIYHQDATYVVKTVTGQSWVTAGSYIECKVLGLTTADHTPEDAILEGVQFEINNIVVGTGFDIIGHAPEGTYGKYSVKCLGQ
jgi:hypothetical protein